MKPRFQPLGLLLVFVVVGITRVSAADPLVWTGTAGDGDFNASTNWNNIPVFNLTTDLAFGTPPMTPQAIQISGLVSAQNVTFSGSTRPTYTFSGTSTPELRISGNIIADLGESVTFNNTLTLTLVAGSHTIQNASTTGDLRIQGTIGETGGTASLMKTGAGTLELTGGNTYTGLTWISDGVLSVSWMANGGAMSSLGQASNNAGNLVIDGGTLKYTGPGQATDRLFTVGLGGATIDTAGGTLDFSNTGSLNMSDPGSRTLTLTGSASPSVLRSVIGDPSSGVTSLVKSGSGMWSLNGENWFSGTTKITGGMLRIGNPLALQNSRLEYDNYGGSLVSASSTVTLGGLTGSQGLDLTTLSSTPLALTVAVNGRTDVYSGVLSGGGSLTKTGSGTLVLSGINIFNGGTTITTGTLEIATAGTFLPGSDITAGPTSSDTAAKLLVSEDQTIRRLYGYGIVDIALNKTFTVNMPDSGSDPTHSSSVFDGTMIGSGSFVLGGPGTLTLQGALSQAGGTSISNGTLILAGGSISHPTADFGVKHATFNASAGAEVSSSNVWIAKDGGQTATVSFNDSGTTLTAANALGIGSSGNGTLSVLNGATGSVASATLGQAAGGSGRMSVGGAGSSVAVTGSLTVGGVGHGEIAVTSGGALSAGSITISASSDIAEGSDWIAVSGAGSTLTTSGALVVGASNDNSNLVVDQGADASIGGSATIGTHVDSFSYITIDGAGSTWSSAGLTVGTVGPSSSFQVNNGATASTGSTLLGEVTGGYGQLSVSGAGSALTATLLKVGYAGTGMLSVGSGASATISGETVIGYGGYGSANIDNGTLSTTGNATLGASAGVDGYVSIAAPTTGSSAWNIGGNLTIGAVGNGTIVVGKNGALTVNSGSGTITLAGTSGSMSGLTIGAMWQTTNVPAPGGIVNAAEVTTAANTGNGFVSFNTTGTAGAPYYFTKDGTGAGAPITITGATRLVNNAGHTVIKGSNTYTGFTEIKGGTLHVGSANALPAATALGIGSGAVFSVDFDQTISRFMGSISDEVAIVIGEGKAFTVAPTAEALGLGNAGTYGGELSGAGAFKLAGVSGSLLWLDGDLSYTGGTMIEAGNTLKLSGASSTTSALAHDIVNNGTLGFYRDDESIDLTVTGMISGSGKVVSNSGFTVLAPGINNTYSGGTQINGGVLVGAGAYAFGNPAGTITVNSGGTLAVMDGTTVPNPVVLNAGSAIGGHGTFASNVVIDTGVILKPEDNDGDTIGTLTFTELTLHGGGVFEWNVLDTATYDKVAVTGASTLTFESGSSTAFTFKLIPLSAPGTIGQAAGFTAGQSYSLTLFQSPTIENFDTFNYTIDDSIFSTHMSGVGQWSYSLEQSGSNILLNFTPAAVPEPSTWALMITGLAVVAAGAVRRRKAS